MDNSSLVLVEDMSVKVSDKFARSRFWDQEPILKNQPDFDRFVSELSGKRILDLGCGYGLYGPDFVKASLDYHGIDNSPAMIREARRDNPRLNFRIMSMNRLMFPENHFDGIWSCCSITTTPKAIMKKSLERMRVLLKPKGVILVVVPSFGFAHDGIVEGDDTTLWHAIYSAEEFRELFRSCGFQVAGFWEDHANNAMSLLARK